MRDGTGKEVRIKREKRRITDSNVCNIQAMALVTETSYNDMYTRFDIKGRQLGEPYGIRPMMEIAREMGYRPRRITRKDFQESIDFIRDEYDVDLHRRHLTDSIMVKFPKAFRHWGRRILLWDGDSTSAYVNGARKMSACGDFIYIKKAYRVE